MIRPKSIFITGMISLIGFLLISTTYQTSFVVWFDEWLIHHIQKLESSSLTDLANFLSFIGSAPIVIIFSVAVVVVLLLFKLRLEVVIFVVTVGCSALLNSLLKLLFERTRPIIHPIIVETGFSFPSGHAMSAFTFYGMVTLLLWTSVPDRSLKIALISLGVLMIVCTGLSRIYLGVHYPSDIIGGYLASCTWLMVMLGVLLKLRKRRT